MWTINRVTLIIVFLLNFGCIYGQFYFSSIDESMYLFGPEIMDAQNELVSHIYIANLLAYKSALNLDIEDTYSYFSTLHQQDIKKSKLRKIKERKEMALASLKNELALVDDILAQWQNKFTYSYMMEEIRLTLEQGSCIEVYTNEGILYGDEIQMIDTLIELSFDVKIVATEKEEGTKWVKKRASKNCLSANPDDCFVWCLVTEKAGYRINDAAGKEIEIESCPNQGIYVDGQCVSTFSFSEVIGLELRQRAGGGHFELEGYEIVGCK